MNFIKRNIDESNDSKFEKGEYHVVQMANGHKLEAFLSIKPSSDKLVVFFQGAIDRKKHTPPIFHRWSWSRKVDENVLSLNDPLLNKHDDLRIGWYAGACNFEYIRKYSAFIKKVCLDNNILEKNVVFYGSSAGGFAAVALGGVFRNGVVIVNNPQTNILNYYADHVKEYLEVAFPGLDKEQVLEKYAHRVDLVEMFKKSKYIPEIHYYQNIEDEFHYQRHFLPFVTRLLALGHESKLRVNLYGDVGSGHGPMGRDESLKIIKDVLN